MDNSRFRFEIGHYERYGYVVFRNHVDSQTATSLTNTALQTLFDLAFKFEKKPPEPTFENLKYFTSHEARKALVYPSGIWVNGHSEQPLCSRVTGLCYGSYLPDVQSKFTMTLSTFEKIAACYGTCNIAQIYGPKRYTIRFKDGLEGDSMMDCNLMSDFNNVCSEDKILASLVVSVDGTIKVAESGTICLIPGFHHYRKHARIFYSFVGGICRLPLNLSSPMMFPKEFIDSSLPKFNLLISDLHKIRAGNMLPQKFHEPYLDLTLPEKYEALAWKYVWVQNGDMICRSQWLPYYETECKSNIPFIAFHVGYYPIPDDFLGSNKQRILVEALEKGYIMDECQEWEKVKNNTYERDLKMRRNPNTPYFYIPEDDDDIDFAMCVQCVDVEFLQGGT